MRIRIGLCLLCALASCSITAPRDVGNANMITLNVPDDVPLSSGKNGAMRVDYPTASSDLDTYRIAVAKADGRPDYFASARWSEFLPSVVQSALTETLSRSGRFSYADSDEGVSDAKYILHVDIEEFRAIYASDTRPPQADIRILFHVTAAHSDRALMTFTLEEKTQAGGNTLSGVAQAFNASFNAIARETVVRLQAMK